LSHNASDVSSERTTDTPDAKHLLHNPIKSLFTIIMTWTRAADSRCMFYHAVGTWCTWFSQGL